MPNYRLMAAKSSFRSNPEGDVVPPVKQLLLLPHEADMTVIQEQYGDRETEFGRCGQFLNVHLDDEDITFCRIDL